MKGHKKTKDLKNNVVNRTDKKTFYVKTIKDKFGKKRNLVIGRTNSNQLKNHKLSKKIHKKNKKHFIGGMFILLIFIAIIGFFLF